MSYKEKDIIKGVLSGNSYSEVANKYSVSKQTVCNILRRNGYDTQLLAKSRRDNIKSTYYQLECNNCGELFWRMSRHRDNKFCSRDCMGEYMKKHMRKDLSKRCANGSKFYPGVGVKDKDGKWSTKRLSRVVVEQHTGESLSRDDIVHHIDGDSENNNIDNLEVLSNSKHTSLTNLKKWEPINKKTVTKVVQVKRMTKQELAVLE